MESVLLNKKTAVVEGASTAVRFVYRGCLCVVKLDDCINFNKDYTI